MYLSDTGTLILLMDREYDDESPAMRAVAENTMPFKQGALMKNMAAECLMKAGVSRNYYLNRKEPGRMELDFVAELGSEIVAIEIKSGKDRSAPSLSKTIGDSRFDRRMKFENSDIRVDEDGIEHYPLFAIAFIDEMRRKDGDWMSGIRRDSKPDFGKLLDERDERLKGDGGAAA